MPRAINDVDTLQEYIRGFMDRAEHHTDNVSNAALALVGAIIWRKDANEDIKVFVREGNMANVLWVRIGGNRYAFSYDHDTQSIEMREGSTQGEVLHSFDDDSTTQDIRQVLEVL